MPRAWRHGGLLLLILNDNVVVSPTPIVGAPKLMERTGACAIAGFIDPAIASTVASESSDVRRSLPARCPAWCKRRTYPRSAIPKTSSFTSFPKSEDHRHIGARHADDAPPRRKGGAPARRSVRRPGAHIRAKTCGVPIANRANGDARALAARSKAARRTPRRHQRSRWREASTSWRGIIVEPQVLASAYAPFRKRIGSSGDAPLRISKWSCGALTLPV